MAIDTMERETDTALLVVPEGKDARSLFEAKNTDGADKLLAMVRAKVDAFKADLPDINTASGRKKIASFAHKVAKSKTAIEEVGAALAKEAKEIPKRIDANRKHIKDTLDAWRDEVRQPLTDWEKAEEDRVNRIKDDLSELQNTIDDPKWVHRTAELLRERVQEINVDYSDTSEERFGEYSGAAAELKEKALTVLAERIADAEKREAEAAELARLRKEAEDRAAKDREEAIRKEAAEQAERDAEAKAQAERDAAEKRERDLKEAAERAEREKIEAQEQAARAEQKAKEEAEAALKRQQDREKAEAARREENKRHCAAVNRKALAAFVAGGIPEDTAKEVVKLIATRQIPGIQINY